MKIKSTLTPKKEISNKQKLSLLVATTAMAMVLPEIASAGSTTGAEFQNAYQTIVDWTQGYLGKLAAITFAGVGIFMGIRQQSIWCFAMGIGAAIGLVELPDIVDGVFGAALPLL